MRHKKLAVMTGLAGLGLIAVGLSMYWRQRRTGLAGLGRVAEAPKVGGYSDGNMKTVLRASRDMPIEQRVATIQKLVEKSVQDPEMRKLALQITARCPERDQMCEARAIYDAVKKRIRYTGDIGAILQKDGSVQGIDLYQSARRTWQDMKGGDCDDQAILNSTLLALNGINPILRVVRQRNDPDWSHIFCVGQINNRDVALDTTLPGRHKFNVEGSYVKKIDFPA